MYSVLLPLHSLLRWLLLAFLISAVIRAWRGYARQKDFSRATNALRHWTATIGHIQLVVGMLLYLRSPAVRSWRLSQSEGTDAGFFGIVHISLMIAAIVLLTIGSAAAKRKADSRSRYRTMLIWFSAALLLILLAIPWPFLPWAHRPYFRPF